MDSEILSLDDIRTQQSASSQEEAIEAAGAMLVARGLVGPEYVAAMHKREETFSTYLGNGVALPHGTFEVKDSVKGTGIVVLQYPEGVKWGPEGEARLVIGLAAEGEDHINILSELAEVLMDEELCERLWATTDPQEIFEALQPA
jgi:mannitol/fructose-specific phosphotransferase system IIA component